MALTHDERRKRRKAMADMARDGRTCQEIAATFGVSVVTVRTAAAQHRVLPVRCKRIKLPTPEHKRPATQQTRSQTLRIISALQNTTESLAAIGRKFGVCRERVRQVAARAGECGIIIPKRKRGGRHG